MAGAFSLAACFSRLSGPERTHWYDTGNRYLTVAAKHSPANRMVSITMSFAGCAPHTNPNGILSSERRVDNECCVCRQFCHYAMRLSVLSPVPVWTVKDVFVCRQEADLVVTLCGIGGFKCVLWLLDCCFFLCVCFCFCVCVCFCLSVWVCLPKPTES